MRFVGNVFRSIIFWAFIILANDYLYLYPLLILGRFNYEFTVGSTLESLK